MEKEKEKREALGGLLLSPRAPMADGYFKYGDDSLEMSPMSPRPISGKRPRSDHGDVPGGLEYVGYYPREEGRVGLRDTKPIEASYQRYLCDQKIVFYGGGESLRPVAGGVGGHPVDDMYMRGVEGMDEQSVGYGSGRPEMPLPPDASSTLFVEGLPVNCTRREVSHIFRHFAGFQEIRLVNKESRNPRGYPLVLCFVDFSNHSQAAVALDALQGSVRVIQKRVGLVSSDTGQLMEHFGPLQCLDQAFE